MLKTNTIDMNDTRELASVIYSEEYHKWFMDQPFDYRDRLARDCIEATYKLQAVVRVFQESTKENEDESK